VIIGRRRPGEVEIIKGVTEQDVVVTDGTLNVHDGTPVVSRSEAAPQVAS
jgi:hypothetical protein